jgi:hypothetical protein
MIHHSGKCYYSKQEIELPIDISAVDDQPVINKPHFYFQPIPCKLDPTYELGVSVSMLMTADQYVVEKLMFGLKKGDKLRIAMAKGMARITSIKPGFHLRWKHKHKHKKTVFT